MLTVIPPAYEAAENFDNGDARVYSEGRWFYIDRNGNMLPGRKEEQEISPEVWSEGVSVRVEGAACGYIDEKGEFVIPPKFSRAEPFHDGLARVSAGRNGKWGFIGRDGKYAFREKFIDAGDFFEDLARVLVKA